MNIKENERRIVKLFAKRIIIAIIIFAIAAVVLGLTKGKKFTDKIELWWDEPATTEDFVISFDEEGIVNVVNSTYDNGYLIVDLEAVSRGTMIMNISYAPTGESVTSSGYRVDLLGVIHNINNGNYPMWRVACAMVMVVIAFIAIMLWNSYLMAQIKLRYSYLCIFFAGFAVWFTALSILMLTTILNSDSVVEFYSILRSSGLKFMFISLPFCLIFAISLITSNISLIKHEGFRIVNALGIGLSVALLLGEVLAIGIYSIPFSGSMTTYRIMESFLSIYTTIFVILECFLIGSIICGATSSVHMPHGKVDYIIILGCAIRPDGTLYPLLKARVDKALALRTKVIASGNPVPYMVPSGGQGSDEVMAEAEAIANYLKSRGIPEEEILIENRSSNTNENLKFSYALIEKHISCNTNVSTPSDTKVAFATTNYHVFRSGYLSRQLGLTPEGIGSKTKTYFWPNAAVRELIGMLSYMKRILIILFIPLAAYFIVLNMFLPL